MSESGLRKIIFPKNGGFFQDLSLRIKLILRLMGDKRVNILLKLIPIGALVYLVVPDLLPGPVDDAIVLWLGGYLFVELCPPDVVEEHMKAIAGAIPGQWKETNGDGSGGAPDKEEVIEAQFHDAP